MLLLLAPPSGAAAATARPRPHRRRAPRSRPLARIHGGVPLHLRRDEGLQARAHAHEVPSRRRDRLVHRAGEVSDGDAHSALPGEERQRDAVLGQSEPPCDALP